MPSSRGRRPVLDTLSVLDGTMPEVTRTLPRRTPTPVVELTAGQARRIAIAAQQLAAPLPVPVAPGGAAPVAERAVNRGHLNRLLQAIGLLQIDSVNVLARAHLLPIFSRLGPYPPTLLEGAAWPARSGERLLVEAWAHVASLVPVGIHPLLRWRQEQFANEVWPRVNAVRRDHPGFLDTVLAVIQAHGPSSAGDIEKSLEAPGRGTSGWWEWSVTKTACEYLFAVGAIGVAYRRGFERCYDLIDRVLPASIIATPTPAADDAKRALTALAARSHGVGTVSDLADYYRIKVISTRRALADLVEAGEVIPVRVQGWPEMGYLHRDCRIPRKTAGAALLCPFDPLIWERARTERLFRFRYRIEIYTPLPKRQFGYYVFPLLLGERLVGRFDLKADRVGSRLLVQASWVEVDADPPTVAAAAAVELARMARWLGLSQIVVMPRGDLWKALASLPGLQLGVRPAD
ncbi:MAG TPA: crosslink repair DNA glycosylase YcaQ family protein [Nakamurella sp.]